jgi:endonuclease YncB( thermonuclease family)
MQIKKRWLCLFIFLTFGTFIYSSQFFKSELRAEINPNLSVPSNLRITEQLNLGQIYDQPNPDFNPDSNSIVIKDSYCKIYEAKYLQNYDGDTASFDLNLGFGIIMHNRKTRFYGIDTPEINKKISKLDGLKSKEFVYQKLSKASKIFIITFKKKNGTDMLDSFGRILCVIWYLPEGEDNFIHLNQELLDEGLAVIFNK